MVLSAIHYRPRCAAAADAAQCIGRLKVHERGGGAAAAIIVEVSRRAPTIDINHCWIAAESNNFYRGFLKVLGQFLLLIFLRRSSRLHVFDNFLARLLWAELYYTQNPYST